MELEISNGIKSDTKSENNLKTRGNNNTHGAHFFNMVNCFRRIDGFCYDTYNTLLPYEESEFDVDEELFEQIIDAKYVTFPPSNAPNAVKEAWDKVTKALAASEKASLILDLEPPTCINIDGDLSQVALATTHLQYYINITNNYISNLEKYKMFISETQYYIGMSFARAFLKELDY